MVKTKSNNFRKQTYSGSHMLLAALIFGIVGGVISYAAFAAPPVRNSGNGTISLVMVTDKNGDGLPNYGDVVTFKESNTETTAPMVYTECNQNGSLVYMSWRSYDPHVTDQTFTLGGTTAWQNGGAADCKATLQNWDKYSKTGKITTITSMTFHVNP